jgi:uncharacterized protein YgfB (UPF0149 family)
MSVVQTASHMLLTVGTMLNDQRWVQAKAQKTAAEVFEDMRREAAIETEDSEDDEEGESNAEMFAEVENDSSEANRASNLKRKATEVLLVFGASPLS